MEQLPDALYRALRLNDCDAVRAWFEAEPRDPNMRDETGTLVQNALISDDYYGGSRFTTFTRGDRSELIRLLGARGADMNATSDDWLAPLFWSASFGAFVGEMSAMIDYGADVNTLDDSGGAIDSILMHCSQYDEYCEFPRAPLARLLIRRGADVFLTDTAGRDAEHHARLDIDKREDGSALADFLADVKRAGSYQKYLKEPRVELVRLRTLCARGRARPPADPVLERLFGGAPETPSTTKSTRSSRRRPLPTEVFWHVLAYWRTSRDDE